MFVHGPVPKFEIAWRKMIVIAVGGTLNFFVSASIAALISRFYARPYDKGKSRLHNMFSLISIVVMILLSFYIARTLLDMIPYPNFGNSEFNPHVSEIKNSLLSGGCVAIFLAPCIKSYFDPIIGRIGEPKKHFEIN